MEKFLVIKDAEHHLTRMLRNTSMKEHYARLYGPSMLVAQGRIKDFLDQKESEASKTTSGIKQRWERFTSRYYHIY